MALAGAVGRLKSKLMIRFDADHLAHVTLTFRLYYWEAREMEAVCVCACGVWCGVF